MTPIMNTKWNHHFFNSINKNWKCKSFIKALSSGRAVVMECNRPTEVESVLRLSQTGQSTCGSFTSRHNFCVNVSGFSEGAGLLQGQKWARNWRIFDYVKAKVWWFKNPHAQPQPWQWQLSAIVSGWRYMTVTQNADGACSRTPCKLFAEVFTDHVLVMIHALHHMHNPSGTLWMQ